jgi:hypothetical protein
MDMAERALPPPVALSSECYPADDPAADAQLVDLSARRVGWDSVATPGGAPLRWARGGSRFFVELDADVIVPLRRTLTAKNTARDLRRRVAGFQLLLSSEGSDTKQRRQFIVEIDALVAMLDQERAALVSRMTSSAEDQSKLKDIQRWRQWAHVHCCHQPLYLQTAPQGLWSAAAAGPPPVAQQPQLPAPPPSVAEWGAPDPELAELDLDLDLDGVLSMLPNADDFEIASAGNDGVGSSVPEPRLHEQSHSSPAASGKRRRTEPETEGAPATAPPPVGPSDDAEQAGSVDESGEDEQAEMQELGQRMVETAQQFAQMQIQHSETLADDKTEQGLLGIAETKAAVESWVVDSGRQVVVAATPVTLGAVAVCPTLTPVEAFVRHLDRIEQLPPVPAAAAAAADASAAVAAGEHANASAQAVLGSDATEQQEAAWAREMIAALALDSQTASATPAAAAGGGGGGGDGVGEGGEGGRSEADDVDLEWRALACLRARQWDVTSATEMLRRYSLFRAEFRLGTAAGSNESSAHFLQAGVMCCAGGRDGDGRSIWHFRPGRLQDAFVHCAGRREEMVHVYAVGIVVTIEALLRRYPEGQRAGCRIVWDGRGLKPKLMQPGMMKFMVRALFQLVPLRLGGLVLVHAPWFLKKVAASMHLLMKTQLRIDDTNDVTQLPSILGCDRAQLHAELGGVREYDHAAFVRAAS